jgi:class 3 adenylate cyclase
VLSGFGLETMLDLIRRAALLSRRAPPAKRFWGAETVLRRLAAIIAAEVAGYSRLREADEKEPLERLRSRRHDLIDPNSTRGARSETTSDSMLIDFANAVQAARIAAGCRQRQKLT